MLLALVAALAAAAPSPEAEALGRRLAATGALETMLPAIAAKETEEVAAEHPELSRRTSACCVRRVNPSPPPRARLTVAIGGEYAAALSLEDLRTLVPFNETPAAGRWRAAMPGATIRGLAKLGQVDFKRDLVAAFCTRAGKLCRR